MWSALSPPPPNQGANKFCGLAEKQLWLVGKNATNSENFFLPTIFSLPYTDARNVLSFCIVWNVPVWVSISFSKIYNVYTVKVVSLAKYIAFRWDSLPRNVCQWSTSLLVARKANGTTYSLSSGNVSIEYD